MNPSTVRHADRQPQMVKVEQRIMRACVCGQPWPAHVPTDGACAGYEPRAANIECGITMYRHKKRICRVLYAVEQRVRRCREVFEASV